MEQYRVECGLGYVINQGTDRIGAPLKITPAEDCPKPVTVAQYVALQNEAQHAIGKAAEYERWGDILERMNKVMKESNDDPL
jgi:hypothetical protein